MEARLHKNLNLLGGHTLSAWGATVRNVTVLLAVLSVILCAASSRAANVAISALPRATAIGNSDIIVFDQTNPGAGTFTSKAIPFLNALTNFNVYGDSTQTNVITILGAGVAGFDGTYYSNTATFWTNSSGNGYVVKRFAGSIYQLRTNSASGNTAYQTANVFPGIGTLWNASIEAGPPKTSFFGAPALNGIGNVIQGDGAGLSNLIARTIVGLIPYTNIPQLFSTNVAFGALSSTNLDDATYLKLLEAVVDGSGVTYSLNRKSWTNTLNKIRSHQTFNVLRITDGLGAGGMLATVANNLTNVFPRAGFKSSVSLRDPTPNAGQFNLSPSGAAAMAGPQDGYWLKQYGVITDAAGTITLTNVAGGLVGDTFAVAYIKESGAGHFLVQTQINGGTWTTVSGLNNVDASTGGSTISALSTWTFPTPALTGIRVQGVDASKTVRVLDCSVVDSTQTNGFTEADYYGESSVTMLQEIGNANIVTPMFNFWQPDLILFEKIGIGDGGGAGYTTSNFFQFFNYLHTTCPTADIVFCGMYPTITTSVPSSDNQAYTNMLTFRLMAETNNWGIFDGHTPFGDSATMIARSWQLGDGIHGTTAGYAAYDTLLTHWLSLGDFYGGAGASGAFIANLNGTGTNITFKGLNFTNDATAMNGGYSNGLFSINVSNAPGVGTIAVALSNQVPATVGNQQYSPFLSFAGNGWKTTATAGSQPVQFALGVVPIQGAANPSAILVLSNSINGGAWTEIARWGSDGGYTNPTIQTATFNTTGNSTVVGNTSMGGAVISSTGVFTTHIKGNAGICLGNTGENAISVYGSQCAFTQKDTAARIPVYIEGRSDGITNLTEWHHGNGAGTMVARISQTGDFSGPLYNATNGIATWKGNQTGVNVPSVTGSPYSFTNTQDHNIIVYFAGGTVSDTTINGISLGAGQGHAHLQPGQWTTITYSSAPSVFWKDF